MAEKEKNSLFRRIVRTIAPFKVNEAEKSWGPGEGASGDDSAWIEDKEKKKYPLKTPFTIGRSPNHSLVLESKMVSRNHATIQQDGNGDWWLTDLGSSNGTFLNQNRVSQPTMLQDEAVFRIGDAWFRFRNARKPLKPVLENDPGDGGKTIVTLDQVDVWFLLLDVIDYSKRSNLAGTDKIRSVLEKWAQECVEIVEKHKGVVNKYLGDGILAYWKAEDVSVDVLSRMVEDFRVFQSGFTPMPFRLILHRGSAYFGGRMRMGEENISGAEVNFIFKSEKPISRGRLHYFFSRNAMRSVQKVMELKELGSFEIPGFSGVHDFYRFADDVPEPAFDEVAERSKYMR